MSLTQLLQQRLEEESVVVKAAEGYTPEQILLAVDAECAAKIKRIEAIQKDARDQLKAWYSENVMDLKTGEVKGENSLSIGPIAYKPTITTNRTWFTDKLINKLRDKALPFLTVAGGKITDAVKSGVYKWEDFEGCYTEEKSLKHGTGKAE